MDIPLNKNKSWIACLHESIGQLDKDLQLAIMRPAGKACAADLLSLCKKYLGREVGSIEDLVAGWNIIRERHNLNGRWEFQENTLRGVFGECGCPLVRSGLIELHPAQCFCSQGMMETIFSQVAKKTVRVELKRTIGRGDSACEFLVTF
ncbi:MAG TPA: hypothetical protein VF790_11305 [Dissulfurispiraceae bacterium]